MDAQGGESRAKYGDELLKNISRELTKEFCKGFTLTNLKYMRQFYIAFPIGHAVSDKLSWTHIRQLLKVSNLKAREYYAKEASEGNWSRRQLERQIATQYYEWLLSSQRDQASIERLINEKLYCVMPNHIHAIENFNPDMARHVPKERVTKFLNRL
ncbi:MAG: hypothetical protein J1F07_09405 [Muribaculaceae bacterium]|nr:hypothetical protein [Muribaculaceae bacterium]